MSSRVAVSTWTLALVAICVMARPAAAANPDPRFKAAIQSMLDSGWRTTSTGREDAESHFARAQELSPADVRGPYAFALVQIKHHRYTDAAETIADVLEADPKHWGAWQARIWLAVIAKKYSSAMSDLEGLAKAMPREEAAGEAEEMFQDLAQMMGRVFGFMSGPMSKSVKEDQLADCEDRVLVKLTTGRRAAFEKGRRAVAEKFAEMQQDKFVSKTDAVEQEQKQKDTQLDKLKEQKATVDDEKASVDKQATAARATAEKTVGAIDAQAAPMFVTLNGLNAQATTLQGSVASLAAEVALLQEQAAVEADATQRQLLLVQIGVSGRSLAQLEGRLAGVAAQINQIRAQLQALDNQRGAAIAAYEAEMNRLGRKADTLARSEKLLKGATAEASRPVTGSNPKVRALSAGMLALSTYQDFPLEREKRRVLDSFAR